MSEQKYAFPTEVLSLPSKGLLYPKDHPLSSGQIDVKYMTAKEEDILTSSNLIEKGLVIDKLLESVIANPKVKLDDLLIGDKNAIMIAARVLGYGKEYSCKVTTPSGEQQDCEIDLTSFDDKPLDESLYTRGINNFEFLLSFKSFRKTWFFCKCVSYLYLDEYFSFISSFSNIFFW